MAERRMFAKTIVDSDAFLDMPQSTQCLYFHLSMRADDDGFINNPKKIQRMVGASDDDAKLLILKKFIIPFESGIVVIKHWKIHNYIRNDRYKETVYKEEKALLSLDENNSYTLGNGIGIPNGYQMDTQDRLELGKSKDSIDKDSIEEDKKKETFVSIIHDYTEDEELRSALKDFVEMRKKKKGFTTKALKLNLSKLDKLANFEPLKIEIVNQTVANTWASFYPLKNKTERSLPDWYYEKDEPKEEPKEPTKEDHVSTIMNQYRFQILIEEMGSGNPKEKENLKQLYHDLTGRDIDEDNEEWSKENGAN